MDTRRSILGLAVSAAILTASHAHARELTDLDLAALMSMDVSVMSAAKREQRAEDAAAAVFVLTREDIRRSGAQTIPDLLRIVPGVQVARINTRSFAVTARGFNSKFANKLQVLVDGRSAYTNIFSGVMWEEQFVPLAEIERIEVMRGPSGALWGINSMNGVINIITRAAREDRGLHASAGAGTDQFSTAAVQYSSKAYGGDLRLHADHANRDALGADQTDLDRSQVGVRYERSADNDHITARVEYTTAEFGDANRPNDASLPASAEVANVGVLWAREHANRSQTDVRAHYTSTQRGQPGRWDESVTGFDAQHTTGRMGRHLATVGVGYRHVADEQLSRTAELFFTRTSLSLDQWSVYAQDEVYFANDRVRIVAGAKLEDFKYTGLAFQPTLRALWRADDEHTLWAAASRAARTPSRFELHSAVNVPVPSNGLPTFLKITGSEDLDAETLDAYELGWRWRPRSTLTIDVASFHHEYDKLLVQTPRAPYVEPGFPPQFILPLQYANAAAASTRGVEVALEWQVSDRLRLQASSHWLDMNLPSNSGAITGLAADPDYGWSLRVRTGVTATLEMDLTVRGVAGIPAQNIESYESVDVRLGWRPTQTLELSASVDNLFDDEHIEFFDEVSQSRGVELGRSAFARIAWRWGK